MHFKAKSLLIVVILLGIFLSCEKSTVWDLEADESSRLVVEAILTNENLVQEINLSQSYPELNNEIPYVSNAIVQVEAGGVHYIFDPDTEIPGLYKSRSPFKVVNNVDYNLNIQWEGGHYNATSRLAPVAPLQRITFAPFENTDSLILGNFVPLYNLNQQSMYEIDINWSFLSTEEPNRAKTFLYTFKDLDISEIIPPAREDIPFPFLTLVTVRKYGLNDDYAAFLRAKVIETDWNSIYFYNIPENLPSNISNGALGFFSTCSVEERTVIALL